MTWKRLIRAGEGEDGGAEACERMRGRLGRGGNLEKQWVENGGEEEKVTERRWTRGDRGKEMVERS